MDQNSGILGEDRSILPVLLRRYGVLRVTAVITLISILSSVTVTATILYFTEGAISPTGILIAIIVPLVLAPISSYNNNKLVFRLDMAEQRLRLLSNTDELTGTFNRRYFFEQVTREFERAKRYDHHHFSVAILDFDNFKDINDSYSHLVGDEVLKCAVGVCLANLRQMDVFARYGGDEFVFLFPDTSALQAQECLDRILAQISVAGFQHNECTIPIFISIGVADFQKSMLDLNEILREADFALYAAKHQGGMRVIAHPTLTEV